MPRQDLVTRLLARHGRTFCDEIGIDISANTPAPLFQWLVASTLYSARISADKATEAARGLIAAGLTTPARMARASWERRVAVLGAHGYKRFDESTATMLGDTATRLLETHGGDLRRLRKACGRDPAAEHAGLQRFKGIGQLGADIFCREAQAAWPELYPFADEKALSAARRLGLPGDSAGLAALVRQAEFPRLVAALVRTALAGDDAALRDAQARDDPAPPSG